MKNKIIAGILLLAGVALFSACEDEDDFTIYEGSIISTVTTGSADVNANSATVYGTVLDLSSQSSSAYTVGAYYSTSEASVTSGGTRVTGSIDSDGNVTATISGLSDGVTYYYAIYVTLQSQLTYYGEVRSFITTDAAIATADAASVTAVAANLGGTLTGVSDMLESESESLAYGIVVSASTDLEEGREYAATGTTSSYSLTIEGLVPSTTYYYAAYRTLDGAYSYGETKEFTTSSMKMEYVDLGLSVEWAAYNLGAMSEEELGGLYGYGDVTGLLTSDSIYDYITGQDVSETEYDPCTKVQGRMPTSAEIDELLANCTSAWEEVNGVGGYRFTGSNGNSIFLPAAGYREGETVTNEGSNGYYWSGSYNTMDSDYAYALSFGSSDEAAATAAKCYQGLSLRAVVNAAEQLTTEGVIFDNRDLVTGDIEGNGNYRIDIYNDWDGSGTAVDCGLDPTEIVFNEAIQVTFSIEGISAEGDFQAYMVFADGTWAVQNWGYNDSGEGSGIVNGDGTYTLTLSGAGSGLGVFAIDIVGLSEACGGADGISAKIVSIICDPVSDAITTEGVIFDNRKLVTGDIEDNGNYRIDIYNAWDGSGTDADCGLNPEDVVFNRSISVTFSISGISVEGEYQTYMGFADGTWATSNWGYNESGEGSTIVTGDGTYTLTLSGSGSGLGVFYIDITGLVTACGSADGITAKIESIICDGGSGFTPGGDLTVDNEKIFYGDLEDNGRLRIEIYNSTVNNTKNDPPIDVDALTFSKNMAVTFTLSGVTDNLIEGAAGEYVAGLEFAASGWSPSYWSNLDKAKYDAIVTGDGTYTVWMEVDATSSGAEVFCIDISGLMSDISDASLVSATVDAIYLDSDLTHDLSNATIGFVSNGNDGRIEIYNAYGVYGIADETMQFTGMVIVDFTLSGIDGNLIDGAAGSYTGEVMYAAHTDSWSPSSWGGSTYGYCTVNGDGSYTAYTYLSGDCTGAWVFTVDFYSLWSELTDTSAVTVSDVTVTVPGKVQY